MSQNRRTQQNLDDKRFKQLPGDKLSLPGEFVLQGIEFDLSGMLPGDSIVLDAALNKVIPLRNPSDHDNLSNRGTLTHAQLDAQVGQLWATLPDLLRGTGLESAFTTDANFLPTTSPTTGNALSVTGSIALYNKLREYVISQLTASGVTIIDNLESMRTDASLSANQGRILDEKITDIRDNFLARSEVINRLDSDDASAPVAAAQARILAEMIGNLALLSTTQKTSLVAAINSIVVGNTGLSVYNPARAYPQNSLVLFGGNVARVANLNGTEAGQAPTPENTQGPSPLWEIIPLGGGSISVADETGVRSTEVSKITFRGDQVSVRNGASASEIEIWVPPPSFASPFNTNTGVGDARLSAPTLNNWNVTGPGGVAYEIGDWTPGQVVPTLTGTAGGTLTYSITGAENFFGIPNNTTQILVKVFGTGPNPVATNRSNNITGSLTANINNIAINITGFTTDVAGRNKSRISVVVARPALFPQGGRMRVEISHVLSGTETLVADTTPFTTGNLFYNIPGPAATTGATTYEILTPVEKVISGISYYHRGTRLSLQVANIGGLIRNAYRTGDTQFQVSSSGGSGNLALPFANQNVQVGGLSNFQPNNGVPFAYTSAPLPLTNNVVLEGPAIFRVQMQRPTNDATFRNSQSRKMLIDTVVNSAADPKNSEFFEDEGYRVSRIIIDSISFGGGNTWNANDALTNNDLQVGGNLLKHPTVNYSDGFLPANPNRDYSNLGNPDHNLLNGVAGIGSPNSYRHYTREFLKVNTSSRSNLTLTLPLGTIAKLNSGSIVMFMHFYKWAKWGRISNTDFPGNIIDLLSSGRTDSRSAAPNLKASASSSGADFIEITLGNTALGLDAGLDDYVNLEIWLAPNETLNSVSINI